MRVKILEKHPEIRHAGVPGEIVEVRDSEAEILTRHGFAEPADKQAAKPAKPAKPAKLAAPAKGKKPAAKTDAPVTEPATVADDEDEIADETDEPEGLE